ncbi:MAG: Wzz/FepE/Etk N-terminal domain-containing protein [Nitrospirota bacterium]
MAKTENYIRELYFIVFAQRNVIIMTTLLFFVLAVLIAFLWPPVYSASGSVLLKGRKQEKTPEAIEKVELKPSGLRKEDLASEVEIIISPDVVEMTIKALQDKNLLKKDISTTNEVYSIQRSIKTAIIPASNVIGITFFSKNRKDAVNILNTLMEQYIIYRLQVYNPSQAETFYSQQTEKFRGDLDKKEQDLMDIVTTTMVADPQKEMENNLLLKQKLEEVLFALKNEAIEKKQIVLNLDKVLGEKNIQIFSFIDNLSFTSMNSKIQDLYIERGKLLRAYNDESDKIKLIDRQIRDAMALLRSEVITYRDNHAKVFSGIDAKIRNTEDKLNRINTRNVELRKQVADMARVSREVKLNEVSYETFAKRRDEAKVDRTGIATNLATISVLSKAFPSDGPVFPKKGVVIPLGLLAGFITGCSLGFLREFFDHTFKKPSDVISYAGLNVIFSIPEMGVIKPLFKFKFRLLAVPLLFVAAFLMGGVLKDLASIRDIPQLLSDLKAGKNVEPVYQPALEGRGEGAARGTYEQQDSAETDVRRQMDSQGDTTEKLTAEPNTATAPRHGNLARLDEDNDRHIVNARYDKDQSAIITSIKKSVLLYDESEGHYFLLINVFKDRKVAYKESEKLQGIGLKSFVSAEGLSDKGTIYRVLLGPFMRKGDALKIKSGWQAIALVD